LPGAETSQCLGGGGVSSTPALCRAILGQPEPTSLQDIHPLLSSVLLTLERYRATEVLGNVAKVIALLLCTTSTVLQRTNTNKHV
jgi:hypothetical protein